MGTLVVNLQFKCNPEDIENIKQNITDFLDKSPHDCKVDSIYRK
jgi:hypothetical protein